MKDLKPKIPEPVDMKFNERLTKNGVRLLLSDYSINTILFFAQQSGMVSAIITNDTNTYLPFNSDIEGFKSIFPKLTEHYSENFPVELSINCSPDLRQPVISTHEDGSKLSFNLAFELKVYNSSSIFDDPVTEISLDFDGFMQMQYMFDENQVLHVVIFKSHVEKINVQKDTLTNGEQDLKKDISGLLDFIVDSFRPKISNIKFGEMVRNATGFGVENIEFDTRKEHMELALDIVEN